MEDKEYKIPKYKLALLFISVCLTISIFILTLVELGRYGAEIALFEKLALSISCTINFSVSISITISITKYILNLNYTFNTTNNFYAESCMGLNESYKCCFRIKRALSCMKLKLESYNQNKDYDQDIKTILEEAAKAKDELSVFGKGNRFKGKEKQSFEFVESYIKQVEEISKFSNNESTKTEKDLLLIVSLLISKFENNHVAPMEE